MRHFYYPLAILTVACSALMFAATCGRAAESFRAEVPLAEWRFQPGHPGADPVAADWVAVKLPYVWTQTWLRPAAAAKAAWAKVDLRNLNSGWYETEVTVPADWQGRRVALDLRGAQCDAIVSVGDRRIAEVKGPDGRVEITDAVTPGQNARVRLWVTRWWEGTTNQRSSDLLRDLTIQSASRSEWYHTEEELRRAIPG
ncbi:MAG: hypothetical protein KKI08_15420, partial [Armatimonadetes bacterium]|nr:hypothetical protein [Armatimonadota bacterium]